MVYIYSVKNGQKEVVASLDQSRWTGNKQIIQFVRERTGKENPTEQEVLDKITNTYLFARRAE